MNKLRITLFSAAAFLLLAGFDCGGGETKREVCERMGEAYSAQELVAGCATQNTPAPATYCDDYFDSKCEALAEDIEKADHDIEMIIQSKTTCDGLRSVDTYLENDVLEMAGRDCANAGDYEGMGTLCEKMINAYCAKVVELNCAAVTMDYCVTQSWASGLATLGDGYVCQDPDDDTAPNPIQYGWYTASMSEISMANTCD